MKRLSSPPSSLALGSPLYSARSPIGSDIQPLVGYLLAGVAGGTVHARLCRRSAARQRIGGARHHLPDVRRRPAFLAEGSALGARRSRVPGALVQIAVATLLGLGARGGGMGWTHRRAVWCSASRCRSRAPSCCCARMQERRLMETERGRIAVGWLIVEDLAMVLALVLFPALGEPVGRQQSRHRRTARLRRSWPRRLPACCCLTLVKIAPVHRAAC